MALDLQPTSYVHHDVIDVGLHELHDRLAVGDVAVARSAERPAVGRQALKHERAGLVGDRVVLGISAAVTERLQGDLGGRRPAVIDDLAADRRRTGDQDDDVRLLLAHTDVNPDGDARAARTFARKHLVFTWLQAREAELAGGVGLHDAFARLHLDCGRARDRAHRSSSHGLLRLGVAHDALDRTSGNEREVCGRSTRTDLDVLRLGCVLGMARRDQDLSSADGELVPTRAVAEGHGDCAAGLCIQAQPSSVDARPRDRAAGDVRHRARQRLAAGWEDQPNAVIPGRDDVERRHRRFVSLGRGRNRPVPSREIDRGVPIARGLDDDQLTIRRRATHEGVRDRAGAVGDGHDDVRGLRGGWQRVRASRARCDVLLGSGRLAGPRAVLVEPSAKKEQTDDDDGECDSFFHENDSHRCASRGRGALSDRVWCQDRDDGSPRLSLLRMKTVAQFVERDLEPSPYGAFGNPGATSDFGAGEILEVPE